MRSKLKKLALLSAVLPFVLVAALAGLLVSESGARLALRAASSLVDGLQVAKVSGRLVGPLRLVGLQYRSQTIDIDVANAQLDWRLSSLLYGELLVEVLVVDDLDITAHASAIDPEPASAFELPVALPVPLPVRIASAQLNRLTYNAPEQESPLVIDSAQLQGHISSQEVAIAHLAVSTPLFGVEGSARSVLWKKYKTTAALEWYFTPSQDVAVKGAISAEGNRNRLGYKLQAEAQTTNFGDYVLASQGSVNEQSLSVDDLSIVSAHSAMTLKGDGTFAIGQAESVLDIKVSWQALQWPLVTGQLAPPANVEPATGDYLVRSEKGSLTVTGTLANYDAVLAADLSTPQTPSGTVNLMATGTDHSINLHTIEMRALKGVAKGSASLSWRDEVSGVFDITGRGVDPSELFAQWPGQLDFTLRGEHNGSALSVQTAEATGTLRDLPLQLSANLYYDGAQVSIPEFRLRSGDSTVTGHGELGSDKLDFQWDLDSPSLQAFHPDLAGSVTSRGRLSGAMPRPKIEATAAASKLRFQQYALESLALNADLDLAEKQPSAPSTLQLVAKDLQLEETGIAVIQLDVDGVVRQHTIALQLEAESADITATFSGGLEQNVWRGSLNSASVNPLELSPWNLQSRHALYISEETQKIDRACWNSGAAYLCFDAQRLQGLSQGSLELRDFDFQYLRSLWPDAMDIRGSVSGTATAKQPSTEQWAVQGQLVTAATSIFNRDSETNDYSQVLSVEPGSVTLGGDNEQLVTELKFPFVGGGGLSGDIRLASQAGGLSAGALGGSLYLKIPALDFLSALSAELQRVEGAADIELQLAGTLQAPRPMGILVVENAEFELASPGLTLSAVNLSARGDSAGTVNYSGEATSGNGSLAISGQSRLRSVTGGAASATLGLQETSIKITGTQFQLWNTNDARLWASPDITLELVENMLQIKGQVTVPRAQITPRELPQSAVGVSADQVIIADGASIDEVTANNEDGLRVRSRVRVVLGDAVEVQGFGFKGRLQGELAVKQEPDKPVLASGELNILDGEYRAYGQGLVVERGKILFAGGAIDNPGINVRAQRRPAQGVVVGVNVRGELKKPELSIFSEPAMSSSNQLSWLVLGRPFNNTSDAESDYIAQAALLLGVHGGDYLTKSLGENLGLDSIGIETGSGEAGGASDVNQAALVVGKYLTPNLYISYGVGLLESISTVKLRYLITEHWNFETESSAVASGGDIHYSFER